MLMLIKRKKDTPKKESSYEKDHLLSEIRIAKNALEASYSNFQQATDPELIDCYIYMINANQLRYKFLLSRARSINLQNASYDDLYEISNAPMENP